MVHKIWFCILFVFQTEEGCVWPYAGEETDGVCGWPEHAGQGEVRGPAPHRNPPSVDRPGILVRQEGHQCSGADRHCDGVGHGATRGWQEQCDPQVPQTFQYHWNWILWWGNHEEHFLSHYWVAFQVVWKFAEEVY